MSRILNKTLNDQRIDHVPFGTSKDQRFKPSIPVVTQMQPFLIKSNVFVPYEQITKQPQ